MLLKDMNMSHVFEIYSSQAANGTKYSLENQQVTFNLDKV